MASNNTLSIYLSTSHSEQQETLFQEFATRVFSLFCFWNCIQNSTYFPTLPIVDKWHTLKLPYHIYHTIYQHIMLNKVNGTIQAVSFLENARDIIQQISALKERVSSNLFKFFRNINYTDVNNAVAAVYRCSYRKINSSVKSLLRPIICHFRSLELVYYVSGMGHSFHEACKQKRNKWNKRFIRAQISIWPRF